MLAASFDGKLYRVKLNEAGTITGREEVVVLAENFGAQPLDVATVGDDGPFPGTVWAATYGANNITVFEPADFDDAATTCDGEDLATVDDDGDGYTNADEFDNGTDPCNGASRPADFDGTLIDGYKVSDLNDPDDDDDGLVDTQDFFPIDPDNGLATGLPSTTPSSTATRASASTASASPASWPTEVRTTSASSATR